MKEDGPAKGYNTLYLSIPDAEDELDFIKRLLRELRDSDWESENWFSAFKDRLPEDLEIVLKTSLVELKAKSFDWRKPAEKIETLLKSGNAQTLLLIDELPLLVGSIASQDSSGKRAERFLLWLKRLREQYQPRWFFAGSIGLDSTARRLKLSGTIHDLQPVELGEFSLPVARSYLMSRGQFHGFVMTAETIESVLEAVEWRIPFHLNLVFEELRALVNDGHGSPSPALVEVAMQKLLANGRTHFDHWDERLAKMLDGRAQQFCEIILNFACQKASGIGIESIDLRLSQDMSDERSRAEMLRQSLDLLTSDGYLVKQDGVVRFRSALLRRYRMQVQA